MRQLQEKLAQLELLTAEQVDGSYGSATADAVRTYQERIGRKPTGIADRRTQQTLEQDADEAVRSDPTLWIVQDEDT